MTVVVVFFLAFILAVVIGQKAKINAGFLAIAFGFILVWIYGGTSNNFIKAFPVTLFWNYSMPIIFYAFAAANGTLLVMGKKIAYKFRNARWALPFSIAIVGALIATSGAATNGSFITAPLAWSLGMAAGVNPVLVPIAIWCGSFIGSFTPWTSMGTMLQGFYAQYLPGVDGSALAVRLAIYLASMAIIVLVISYFIFKGWKLNKEVEADIMEKPEDFSKHQKITLFTILLFVAIMLIPTILNQFAPAAIWKFMSSNFTIPVTATIGITILSLFGGVDLKTVLTNHVNWNIIYVITGMGMFVTLASSLGVVDALGGAMQQMSKVLVVPCMSLIGSALSFVTSAAVVEPMLMAFMPALSAASGVRVEAMAMAMLVGVSVTSISPISTGGAVSLIGAPKEISGKLFTKMLIIAVALAIISFLLAFVGIFSIGL